MSQLIFVQDNSLDAIIKITNDLNCKKFLLVCDSSFKYLKIKNSFSALNIPYVIFNDFTSNPLYEDVCKGVNVFNNEKCDLIIAVGGGSTIDVAKCIKLYCKMDHDQNYLTQEYKDSAIPLVAIPTTAGTGSESTKYAVIYFDGKKQSVTHKSIIPNFAILDYTLLNTLPIYQKKCTMLDALCQGIESWWSVNSTEESKEYSKQAVNLIMQNKNAYINENSEKASKKIILASNFAGRAINITQTTAAHAMSYKITSLYNLPHGHAVAICLPYVWEYMKDNLNECVDIRGKAYLNSIFTDISASLNCTSNLDAITKFKEVLNEINIAPPKLNNERELELLTKSVNPIRLKNNPVILNHKALNNIYKQIFKI